MGPEFSFIECKSALSRSHLPELKYSLNPYYGCSHGCIYCYARSYFRDKVTALSWGSFVKAKQNIVEVLIRQLPLLPVGLVGVSTITDPYQPLEASLQLARRCIEALQRRGFPVSIQTKSALVLKDIDIISLGGCEVGVTITTLERDLASRLQPYASPPDELAQVLQEYNEKNVPTWVFLGPIIPEVNDDAESIRNIIEVAKKSGSKVLFDKLNLRPWVLDSMKCFLEHERTGLLERLPGLLRRDSIYWQDLKKRIEQLGRELGVRCQPVF
jgi:DNA repair photolyase